MRATVYRRRRIPAARRRFVAQSVLRTASQLMVTSLIVTSLIVTSLIVTALIVTACSASATTTEASTSSADAPAIVAAESPAPPSSDSPTFPDGADQGTVAINVLPNPDGAAIDDALAELQARKRNDQVIVQSDFDGCDLDEARALPFPDSVMVLLEWEPVDCAIAVKYRALFLLDATGENQHGPWDYVSGVPPVIVSSVQN